MAKALPKDPVFYDIGGIFAQETEDAILLEVDGDNVWLPKSQIEYDGSADRGDYMEVELPDWLCEQRCLAGQAEGKLTSQTISAAIKNLIHEKAQLKANLDALEKEADWLADALSTICQKDFRAGCGFICPNPEKSCLKITINDWREAARRAVESKPDLFDHIAEHPDTKFAPEEPC